MSINRRAAIRHLAILSAGSALLPSCFHEQKGDKIPLRNLTIDDSQQELLEELTQTLIPGTDTPGAKEVSAHRFVWKMLDDCATADDRAKFLRGMKQFDAAARSAGGGSFVRLAPAQREALLAKMESRTMPDADLNFFYSTTKRLTIQAYTTSEYFLTKVQVYELVPGRWHGCVPVKVEAGQAS